MTGRGLTAPDLVRAYTWYVLSAIGGDPDAAISQNEVVKKMTKDQIEAAHELMQSYQAAKWVVNRGAIAVVDKALDLAGGGGYMSSNTLSRLYRDVRAGPFMQPHSPIDAREYIGQVVLEQFPLR